MRIAWVALPATMAVALGNALSAHSTPVATVLAVACWLGWAAGLVAALVPHPVGLTALRVLAPAALLAGAWSATADGAGPAAVVAVAGGALALLAVVAPTTVDSFVDGASYGPERRMALRAPAPLILGPLPLAVAVVVAGTLAGPLLLAAGQWAVGAVALVVGAVAARTAALALHGLSRRWVVFVPAGFVLADRTALGEPLLLPRPAIASIGPAERGTGALDLTARAAGLVLEVRLAEPLTFPVRTGRDSIDNRRVDAVLIAPVRPGALLRRAREARLPIG